jgi:TLD/LysM domain
MQQCEIQPGETLVSISIREKVSVVALRRLNKLYGNEIFPGQILSLRPIPAQRIASESCSAVDLFFEEKKGTSDLKSGDVADTVPSVVLDKTDSNSPALDVSNLVKGPTLVGNILDAKSAIATSAGEKLSAIRSLISSRRIQIEEPDTFSRDRSMSDASVASLSISYTEKKALYDKDELEKPPPTLLGNSNILTPEYAKKLRRYLPSMQQIENWRLLYSVLKDGADLNSFFRKTKNNKYTVIIVETINGEIFGGFSSKEWITSPNFCKYGSCLIYYISCLNSFIVLEHLSLLIFPHLPIVTIFCGTDGSGESFLFKFDSNKVVEHYPWAGK